MAPRNEIAAVLDALSKNYGQREDWVGPHMRLWPETRAVIEAAADFAARPPRDLFTEDNLHAALAAFLAKAREVTRA